MDVTYVDPEHIPPIIVWDFACRVQLDIFPLLITKVSAQLVNLELSHKVRGQPRAVYAILAIFCLLWQAHLAWNVQPHTTRTLHLHLIAHLAKMAPIALCQCASTNVIHVRKEEIGTAEVLLLLA